MDHCWDGFYTCQKRLSRFPALIQTGDTTTEIKLSGSSPEHYRFKLEASEGDATTVTIFYSNAKAYGVYDTEGKYVPQTKYDT